MPYYISENAFGQVVFMDQLRWKEYTDNAIYISKTEFKTCPKKKINKLIGDII